MVPLPRGKWIFAHICHLFLYRCLTEVAHLARQTHFHQRVHDHGSSEMAPIYNSSVTGKTRYHEQKRDTKTLSVSLKFS